MWKISGFNPNLTFSIRKTPGNQKSYLQQVNSEITADSRNLWKA